MGIKTIKQEDKNRKTKLQSIIITTNTQTYAQSQASYSL